MTATTHATATSSYAGRVRPAGQPAPVAQRGPAQGLVLRGGTAP
jgi:hypothetical protein